MPRERRPTKAVVDSWRALLDAHTAIVARLDEDLRRVHDLSLEWYDVLFQLAAAGDQLTMGDLADRLLIAPSNCTRRLERMTEAGLVERSRDADDNRVVHARLMPAGRDLQRRAASTHLRGIQRHLGRFLTDSDAELMTRTLRAAAESAIDHPG